MQVKLRRRTNGEVWEVVNMQEWDETSILKPLKKVDASEGVIKFTELLF